MTDPDKYEWLSTCLHSHLLYLMAVCISKGPHAKCQVPTDTEMKCHITRHLVPLTKGLTDLQEDWTGFF